jgi:hypothetical protein
MRILMSLIAVIILFAHADYAAISPLPAKDSLKVQPKTDIKTTEANEDAESIETTETIEPSDTIEASGSPTDPPEITISSEINGLDSLGITTDTVVTTNDGGTKKVSLERSVFHREKPFVYNSEGRRDPFRALIVDEKKEGEIETDLLRLEGASLAGVVWSDGTYLAIVRDADGQSFFLREGDPIFTGKLVTVTETQATFETSDFGDYQRVTLKVVPKVSKKDKG